MLAQYMGYDSIPVQKMYLAGALHDIGNFELLINIIFDGHNISSVGESLFGEKLCKFFKLLQIYQKTPYRFSIIDNLYGVYS
ncbi:hypothetical protein DW172_14540 [Agathobacter rectalis]|jgi:uncharacterized protein (UPF0210 family)|uniref:Uncharacterized protein n=1 Tax=Agathobacter rectalis TaxID=39491 RepID=A0A412PZH4_9FIRM|nr:hypothetical protein DWX07_11780 [Agathobacter rectalis]RGT77396.1 hypothetical protein DWX06_15535 [Agathobacter rectalis]RHI17925.1 hypothetical protein DW172_14540 [Agathobacter rectalis]